MTQTLSGRSLTATGLIGVGLIVLFAQIFGFSLMSVIWPLFVAAPGLAFLYFAVTGGKKTVGLAIPGAIVAGTGAILFLQNLTGHWESWAYAWALYPVFLGMALSFMGERTGENNTYRTGQGFVRYGGMGFIGLAAFFELVVFNSGGFLSGLALPAFLIAIGGLMLISRPRLGSSRKRKEIDDEPLFVGAKLKNNDRLQQEIDAALAEDDSQVEAK